MTNGQSARNDPGALFQSREVAEAWRRGEAERDAVFRAANELMLDLAGVGPGRRVLDVAAGTGAQTLHAARRVGPSGYVLATDISASMLELAAESAREAGLANVETRAMDAQRLDLEPDSFDAAISRNGLMLMPDVQAALQAIRRILRPGGKLAAIVFSTPDKNPYMSVPQAVFRRRAGLPWPSPGPGRFVLGNPGALEEAFRRAGFSNVAVHAVPTRRSFASLEEAMARLTDTSPLLREVMENLSEPERAAAWAEVEQELRRYARPQGFEATGESLVGVGTKDG